MTGVTQMLVNFRENKYTLHHIHQCILRFPFGNKNHIYMN